MVLHQYIFHKKGQICFSIFLNNSSFLLVSPSILKWKPMYVFTFPFLNSIPQSQLEAECKENSSLQGHRWLPCPLDIQPTTGRGFYHSTRYKRQSMRTYTTLLLLTGSTPNHYIPLKMTLPCLNLSVE